jgi:hypothetical protein
MRLAVWVNAIKRFLSGRFGVDRVMGPSRAAVDVNLPPIEPPTHKAPSDARERARLERKLQEQQQELIRLRTIAQAKGGYRRVK